MLTTTGGRAPSPTDGACIRHGAFASDTVYTHATPRGGAWDSLPGRLRAPRLAPEPSRDTAGRPLRSTPPHTGDALALKALHPWRDARPAHTEGHVAAGPACPAGTRFLPRGCRPRPAQPRPAGHAHTCTIVRRCGCLRRRRRHPGRCQRQEESHSSDALPCAPPPRLCLCPGHMATASDQDQLCPSRLKLEWQGAGLASGASSCTHQLSSQLRSGLDGTGWRPPRLRGVHGALWTAATAGEESADLWTGATLTDHHIHGR